MERVSKVPSQRSIGGEMFQGLTVHLVNEAVAIVTPMIEQFLGWDRTGGRHDLYLVVLKPETEEILYETAFGGPLSEWKHPYNKIALAKARQCARTGMVGRTLLRDAPWLIEPGDVRYVGGVVENGLVVAASGVQDHFDEMISWMVLSVIQGLCRDEVSKFTSDDPDFFGEQN
ncbi:MAG: hypothetical protein US77_C0012G0001 [Microgenomates group bacterium GW2011_GWC1_38_14]|nr:MAG: hypothetical protein US07_C0011G0001 [Candidatus Levybacteria bacterium GW2011_GWB1_36_18]KKQ57994.1 MAG: hypothetical protein US77_C0012G0001 [Microgenomates group bacterium GW2011_GWC1_38_14]